MLVLAAGFVVFCEVNLARARKCATCPSGYGPILCMGIGLTIPFGGIAYLVFGKVAGHARDNDQGNLSMA